MRTGMWSLSQRTGLANSNQTCSSRWFMIKMARLSSLVTKSSKPHPTIWRLKSQSTQRSEPIRLSRSNSSCTMSHSTHRLKCQGTRVLYLTTMWTLWISRDRELSSLHSRTLARRRSRYLQAKHHSSQATLSSPLLRSSTALEGVARSVTWCQAYKRIVSYHQIWSTRKSCSSQADCSPTILAPTCHRHRLRRVRWVTQEGGAWSAKSGSESMPSVGISAHATTSATTHKPSNTWTI